MYGEDRSTAIFRAKELHQHVYKKISESDLGDLKFISENNAHGDVSKKISSIIEELTTAEEPWIQTRLEAEFFGSGPIFSLLENEEISEIIINGNNSIVFELRGQLYCHQDHFFTNSTLQNFIDRLCSETSTLVHLDRPFTNAIWRDFRVHIMMPPLVQGGPHVSLRRHPKTPWCFNSLRKNNWARANGFEILKTFLNNKLSFLLIGATGSGKTSALNACLSFLPNNERIITIEDTAELKLPNSFSTQLVTRDIPGSNLQTYSQEDLVKQALRMRPDRLVIGEVRGAEAKDLLLALSTGHGGSIGTLHADHPRQALFRLEMLIQMGAPQWTSEMVRKLILFGIHGIVSVQKINGHRRLDKIMKITSLEPSGFCLETLYDHDQPDLLV